MFVFAEIVGDVRPRGSETVALSISVINNGTENLFGVSATLTAASELITITSSTVEYGTVNIGETSSADFGVRHPLWSFAYQ